MPIYEYRCAACGHQEDHLQKVSEAPLTKCPACGRKKYQKQLTAAGFQLKGSGWYATDFKGSKSEKKTEAKADAKAESTTESKTESKTEAKTEKKADKKETASSTN
jgi:putative FmdB family regulatory protein